MIQISPQTESSQAAAVEAIHKPEPAPKKGQGVFGKILAGLLQKAGEKEKKVVPAEGEAPEIPGLTGPPAADSADGSALFPGRKSAGAGKKPEKTGEPELAGEARTRRTGKLPAKTAGDLPPEERSLVSGEAPPLHGPERAERPADTAKVPAGVPPAGGTDHAAEDEQPVPAGSLDSGLFRGLEPDGGAETGEIRANGTKKSRDQPLYADSPEENFSTGQDHDTPGRLLPGGTDNPAGNSREGPHTRLSESRSKERRRDKITLEVRDFRTKEEQSPGLPASQNLRLGETRTAAGRGETELVVELRGGSPGREIPQAAEQNWESRAGRSFEDFLARELHQNLNGDIVRHASVALRDGGAGTIRLALRPETLGNVKIRLEMADNKVTGHIIVESEEALRAFERELAALEQAFRDSGFDAADLDMSLGGGGTDRGWGEGADRSSLPEHLAALRYDAASERMESPDFAAMETQRGIFTRNGRIAVNMLV
ncbi:MAG: flagellar hook-length control protein FliK [Treponema sp.]|nr:flagellar hook-length control protein FliK [Treponema sp.]